MSGTVKVADFGLSEDMYSTNYFRQGSGGDTVETKVPIRWMALECIEEGLYTEKSDVVRTYTQMFSFSLHAFACSCVIVILQNGSWTEHPPGCVIASFQTQRHSTHTLF